MCYPCRHCGQCELKKPRAYGVCPLCGHDNGPDAAECARCGFAFPPRAGKPDPVSPASRAGGSCLSSEI